MRKTNWEEPSAWKTLSIYHYCLILADRITVRIVHGQVHFIKRADLMAHTQCWSETGVTILIVYHVATIPTPFVLVHMTWSPGEPRWCRSSVMIASLDVRSSYSGQSIWFATVIMIIWSLRSLITGLEARFRRSETVGDVLIYRITDHGSRSGCFADCRWLPGAGVDCGLLFYCTQRSGL